MLLPERPGSRAEDASGARLPAKLPADAGGARPGPQTNRRSPSRHDPQTSRPCRQLQPDRGGTSAITSGFPTTISAQAGRVNSTNFELRHFQAEIMANKLEDTVAAARKPKQTPKFSTKNNEKGSNQSWSRGSRICRPPPRRLLGPGAVLGPGSARSPLPQVAEASPRRGLDPGRPGAQPVPADPQSPGREAAELTKLQHAQPRSSVRPRHANTVP